MKALIAFVVIALVAVAGYKYFGIGSVSAPALAPPVSTSESAPKAAESMEDGTLTDEQSQALEAKEKAENQKTLKTPAPTVVPATSKGTYEPYDAAKLALATEVNTVGPTSVTVTASDCVVTFVPSLAVTCRL